MEMMLTSAMPDEVELVGSAMEVALAGLGASKHLDREKALRHVTGLLQKHKQDAFASGAAQDLIVQLWSTATSLTGQEAWEARLGGLSTLKVMVSLHCPLPADSVPVILHQCTSLLEDPEPRVRAAVGELLGAVSPTRCCDVWQAMQRPILLSIQHNWDRDALARQEQADAEAQAATGSTTATSLLGSILSDTYKPQVPGQGDMRHGTEGWQCLESSLRALLAVVQGSGRQFGPFITRDILDLTARFVREASHLLVGAISHALKQEEEQEQQKVAADAQVDQIPTTSSTSAASSRQHTEQHDPATSTLVSEAANGLNQAGAQPQPSAPAQAPQATADGVTGRSDSTEQVRVTLAEVGLLTAPLLADGLTDSWSQVRYAACLGARSLLLAAGPDLKTQLLHHLLPALCLNRYYVADGVRSAAQDTWRMVMQDNGRQAVAQHIHQVVQYYIAQSKAMHHGVREAAAACISELAEKIDSQVVVPHMTDLLQALLLSCKDMAWPVRDAACVAAGRCCRALPAACAQFLPQLMQLWVAHLWDNVHSVRANSAAALADVLVAYPDDPNVLQTIKDAIDEFIPKVNDQARDSPRGRSPTRHESGPNRPASHGTTMDSSPGTTTSTSLTTPTDNTQQQQQHGFVNRSDVQGGRPGSRSPVRAVQLGRSRSPTPSKGRMLSPARLLEQQVKAALAANPDMFGSFEDVALFSEAAVNRFTSSTYLKGDGCMDFGFSRDQEPWEATDGAVLMICELAGVRPDVAVQYLEPLAHTVARGACDFDAAPRLRETVWRCLPRIAKSIGKQQLKRYLEPFLRPLFEDLTCGTQLTETAAGKAVAALRDFLGPNILAARLTEAQAHALRTCHSIPARAA